MDVLDHSSNRFGYGGKMCIDGTKKLEEELEDGFSDKTGNLLLTESLLRGKFPEIRAVNVSLLKIKISCLIISLEKNRPAHIKELHHLLCETTAEIEGIKLILYIEPAVDPNELTIALWRFCNNIDPKRDNIIYEGPSHTEKGKIFACMGLDGTRKTKEMDNFHRDWPNIIVADDKTISAVDIKWDSLGIGPFISSPSLRYKSQLYGEEAVVD
jgi:4-hydroxy-3-polyprenylbenzoate decarboxylase